MVTMTLLVAAVLGAGNDLEDGVLDFTSPKCGPCQTVSPVVARLARQGYPIRKVECESNQDLVRRFNVQSIPTFVLIVDGKEQERQQGVLSEQELVRMCARVPRQDNGDSLGAPGPFPFPAAPSQMAPRSHEPEVTEAPPRVETPKEKKNGLRWPFAPKKEEPPREPPANEISRGKPDERPFPEVPVQGNPLAASVRIRIRDAKGDSYGSGTIIDSRIGRTIIMTCGHLFRNWNKQTKIEVEWFGQGEPRMMIGTRLYHDLEQDLGLIEINSDCLPVCRVAPPGTVIPKGTPVLTVGCSGGDKPTVQHMKVTWLNRFGGPDNIEVSTMPVEGRSGGGLFTKDGQLIGICSGADEKYKEGYYIHLKAMYQILDHVRLSHLYDPAPADDEGIADDAPPAGAIARPASKPGDLEDDGFVQVPDAVASGRHPDGGRRPVSRPGKAAAAQPAAIDIEDAMEEAGDAEIVMIIRPVNQPGAASRVVVLNRASKRFLDYLADERSDRPALAQTALETPERTTGRRASGATQKVRRPATPETLRPDTAEESPATPAPQAYRRQATR